MIAFMVSSALALPINVIIAILIGETMPLVRLRTSTQMALGILTGTFIQWSGSILFRLLNVLTDNPGVKAIYYATPCPTLIRPLMQVCTRGTPPATAAHRRAWRPCPILTIVLPEQRLAIIITSNLPNPVRRVHRPPKRRVG